MGGVLGQVGDRDAGADERGLVADHVDAVEQVGPVGGVADVEHGAVPSATGGDAVGLRQQHVDPHDLVAGGVERRADRARR